MNIFHKSSQRLFCLLVLMVLNSSLNALTFRSEPLTNFIEHGQVLCSNFPENNFVILELENDNFDIYSGDINKLDDLKEIFEEVMASRGACIGAKICTMSSNTINYHGSYLVGRERMDITAKSALNLIRCRLESPMISITGSTMNFADSFLINPEVLNIIIDRPGSAYEVIQILFYNQPENPTVITGEIDLDSDEQGSRLIISNVKEIRVQVAWDNILSENAESASEDSEAAQQLAPNVSSDEEVCSLTASESACGALEETAVIKSNSGNHSTLAGFVAKSRQAIAAFYKKYITPYL